MHDINKFIKNNLLQKSPVPCIFKAGDKVTFKNEYGVKFHDLTVIGFSMPTEEFLSGRFIHLNSDAYWFPHHADELTI